MKLSFEWIIARYTKETWQIFHHYGHCLNQAKSGKYTITLWWQPILIEWCQDLEMFLLAAALCKIANSIHRYTDIWWFVPKAPLCEFLSRRRRRRRRRLHRSASQMEDVIIVQMDGRIMKGKQTTATRPNISLHYPDFVLPTQLEQCCRQTIVVVFC